MRRMCLFRGNVTSPFLRYRTAPDPVQGLGLRISARTYSLEESGTCQLYSPDRAARIEWAL